MPNETHHINGLAFVGAESGCGKTVVMTGLASVLCDYGANIRAIKPLGIGAHKKDSAELSFMSIISESPVDYPLLNLNFPPSILESEWKELLLTCTKSSIFSFIELPGSCATPLNFLKDEDDSYTHNWKSVGDLVNELKMDCVLVAKHDIDALEKIELAVTYLKAAKIKISAIVTVETNDKDGKILDDRIYSPDFELMLTSRYNISYLGKLSYSPAISVPKVTQGNLKKSIEKDLDLLALRRMVELPIA